MIASAPCPSCGSPDTRLAHRENFGEVLRSVFGSYPMRCRRCDHRFHSPAWNPFALRYARCPKCFRMELSTWSEQYYHVPRLTRWKLRLGATPYRCDCCRKNFASFRACKVRFSWRKLRNGEPRQTADA